MFSINWASTQNGFGHDYRGSRDHHIITWALSFDNFSRPLFYNSWKEEQLAVNIRKDRVTYQNIRGKRSIQNLFNYCPRTRKQRDYIKSCIHYGCSRRFGNGLYKKI